jgi:hypothetical protein
LSRSLFNRFLSRDLPLIRLGYSHIFIEPFLLLLSDGAYCATSTDLGSVHTLFLLFCPLTLPFLTLPDFALLFLSFSTLQQHSSQISYLPTTTFLSFFHLLLLHNKTICIQFVLATFPRQFSIRTRKHHNHVFSNFLPFTLTFANHSLSFPCRLYHACSRKPRVDLETSDLEITHFSYHPQALFPHQFLIPSLLGYLFPTFSFVFMLFLSLSLLLSLFPFKTTFDTSTLRKPRFDMIAMSNQRFLFLSAGFEFGQQPHLVHRFQRFLWTSISATVAAQRQSTVFSDSKLFHGAAIVAPSRFDRQRFGQLAFDALPWTESAASARSRIQSTHLPQHIARDRLVPVTLAVTAHSRLESQSAATVARVVQSFFDSTTGSSGVDRRFFARFGESAATHLPSSTALVSSATTSRTVAR